MTDREAMQQALDFITATNASSQFWLVPGSQLNKTVTALRARLAEPVAYPEGDVVGPCICGSWPGGKCLKCPRIEPEPQTCKPGLQVEEPEPEPFVVKHYGDDERPTLKGNGFDGLEVGLDRDEAEQFVSFVNARITAPPARRPLTDERIAEAWAEVMLFPQRNKTHMDLARSFARAIERAHNITGGNDE